MPDNKNTYEIALVMAGAISAGAYTAGVVDYLLEALMHYQKVRKQFAEENPGKSLHNVQIRVISGASAGGMTGTMLLNAMCDETYCPMYGYSPTTVTDPDILKNVFYRSWVSEKHGIDISYLLKTSDVTGIAPL
ncbi:patatin-like phospholipase family protein, partial [Sulfuricurvum sp.]|uniref:patatin-like phospholipase family protein n=1 Tax=Sulfuricurvum sp. TaxID=2025608 RepID=UPI003BB5787E